MYYNTDKTSRRRLPSHVVLMQFSLSQLAQSGIKAGPKWREGRIAVVFSSEITASLFQPVFNLAKAKFFLYKKLYKFYSTFSSSWNHQATSGSTRLQGLQSGVAQHPPLRLSIYSGAREAWHESVGEKFEVKPSQSMSSHHPSCTLLRNTNNWPKNQPMSSRGQARITETQWPRKRLALETSMTRLSKLYAAKPKSVSELQRKRKGWRKEVGIFFERFLAIDNDKKSPYCAFFYCNLLTRGLVFPRPIHYKSWSPGHHHCSSPWLAAPDPKRTTRRRLMSITWPCDRQLLSTQNITEGRVSQILNRMGSLPRNLDCNIQTCPKWGPPVEAHHIGVDTVFDQLKRPRFQNTMRERRQREGLGFGTNELAAIQKSPIFDMGESHHWKRWLYTWALPIHKLYSVAKMSTMDSVSMITSALLHDMPMNPNASKPPSFRESKGHKCDRRTAFCPTGLGWNLVLQPKPLGSYAAFYQAKETDMTLQGKNHVVERVEKIVASRTQSIQGNKVPVQPPPSDSAARTYVVPHCSQYRV